MSSPDPDVLHSAGSAGRRSQPTFPAMFLSTNRIFGYVKAAAALLAVVLTLAVARADVKVGDVFPPLTTAGVTALAGAELPATAGKVVLVDFWASWCTPCKASFPTMAELYKEYSGRGFVLAAVGVDEKASAATSFAKKLAPPFPTLHDRDQKFVRLVGVPTMPTSYLVGRDGRVRFVHQGFHGEATAKELRTQIESLLAEKN